jgi:hypothetical protein
MGKAETGFTSYGLCDVGTKQIAVLQKARNLKVARLARDRHLRECEMKQTFGSFSLPILRGFFFNSAVFLNEVVSCLHLPFTVKFIS